MERSFGLLFYLKKPKHCREGQMPVYLRITVNGVCAEVSSKRKSERSKWNVTAGRADGKTEFAKALNAYLEVLQRKVYDARKQLLEMDKPVTAENIKTLLLGKKSMNTNIC